MCEGVFTTCSQHFEHSFVVVFKFNNTIKSSNANKVGFFTVSRNINRRFYGYVLNSNTTRIGYLNSKRISRVFYLTSRKEQR